MQLFRSSTQSILVSIISAYRQLGSDARHPRLPSPPLFLSPSLLSSAPLSVCLPRPLPRSNCMAPLGRPRICLLRLEVTPVRPSAPAEPTAPTEREGVRRGRREDRGQRNEEREREMRRERGERMRERREERGERGERRGHIEDFVAVSHDAA